MALPFVAGLVIGGGAILLFNKRKEIISYTQEKFDEVDLKGNAQKAYKSLGKASQKVRKLIQTKIAKESKTKKSSTPAQKGLQKISAPKAMAE